MNTSRIEEIIAIAEKWDLDALEVEDGNGAVRVVRRSGTIVTAPQSASGGPAPSTAAPVASGGVPDGMEQVTSPMVGIFTTQPYEDGVSPVQAGDMIEEGQPLGYLEAMKMVTAVEAPCGGCLKEILAADGQSVEFGQPLFLVDPSGGEG